MTSSAPPSQTAEDYLKEIYSLGERDPHTVTTSGLSQRLGLSASSVSGMLRKLVDRGLIEHRPYGAITLTDTGRAAALAVIRRHRLVEMFLVARLGYGWDEVHDEAEILEHAVSEKLVERIDVALGRPRFDPHGDPIPDANGDVPVIDAVPLADLPPGTTGRVVRADDRDPRVLQHLTQLGIALGDTVTVVEELPFDGGLQIRTECATHTFPPVLAASVWITPA